MDFLANVTIRPARQIVQATEAAAGRRRRAERRVNVRAAAAQPRGEVELHAMDASHLRRTISGAWRFDGLMDAAALAAALQRTVDRYPLVAGWLEPRSGGKLALRWDAAARGRGAAWFEAVAPGSPPKVRLGDYLPWPGPVSHTVLAKALP
ncbi:hypothetical protein MNEG_8163 [Monoraphidium neglectum]|jgi:hypothetical protein|uniref:Uncharacterized protein n=1 Tax=Monoraphidium neglectum TaxID=145388 RepID=A0A0D2KWZ9_9CHLO|nr:hypothetical protein MNEG_8163 [Monoraphidium neglectum]KIY99798.1 hypothetical protein MNEG_8163 [Monoraphidium neglectum]|eukprot:XP_013898818.1 hypothetical protein MNEG_8163 [Monoraphidium neglectum]